MCGVSMGWDVWSLRLRCVLCVLFGIGVDEAAMCVWYGMRLFCGCGCEGVLRGEGQAMKGHIGPVGVDVRSLPFLFSKCTGA